jgi:transposase-like protein
MQTTTPSSPYKGFRFPQENISHAMWIYHRFSLSYRDVEELLFARGVTVTYETVRQWCREFGQQYANQLPRDARSLPATSPHNVEDDSSSSTVHGCRDRLP